MTDRAAVVGRQLAAVSVHAQLAGLGLVLQVDIALAVFRDAQARPRATIAAPMSAPSAVHVATVRP